jgi:hypothetical protein
MAAMARLELSVGGTLFFASGPASAASTPAAKATPTATCGKTGVAGASSCEYKTTGTDTFTVPAGATTATFKERPASPRLAASAARPGSGVGGYGGGAQGGVGIPFRSCPGGGGGGGGMLSPGLGRLSASVCDHRSVSQRSNSRWAVKRTVRQCGELAVR